MALYVPEYLKTRNRKQVYDLFLRYGELSRAEIVEKTGMSFPTAGKAVDMLLQKGLLTETHPPEGESQGMGRKRNYLRFNPDAFRMIALNFEGQMVEFGAVNLAGQVISPQAEPFTDFSSREEMRALGRKIARIREASPVPVLGIGIGLPADVDPYEKVVIGGFADNSVRGPVSLEELFAGLLEEVPAELYADNDVNLACRGELYTKHESERKKNLCYLTLGSGFGAGMMINGKLWRGSGFRAGEIGQTILQPFDPGEDALESAVRLEDLIGAQALDARFGTRLLTEERPGEAQKARMLRYIVPYLISTLYNYAFTFDINHFVLAGAVPELLGQGLLQEVENGINILLERDGRKVALQAPSSPYSALIGAASFVFHNTLLREFQED